MIEGGGMFDLFKNAAGASSSRRQPFLRAVSVLAIVATALLAGCAKRDSITVGSVPDDYRTNHPIVIAEKEEVLDLPVSASDRGMTKQQRETLEGFLSGYDRSASPVLRIMTPSGAANEVAASYAANDFARMAKQSGIPASRLMITSYQAGSPDVSAPIRVSFTAMKAQTDKCGRWPEDIANTEDNKHYANFGCSYQNNLAAQIANPADLLGPRKETTIDAERRGRVIDAYRKAPVFVARPSQEVDY
jgi:pilus assembly protein CpaD